MRMPLWSENSLHILVLSEYWTLGLHEHGLHPNFFEVSAENNRNIRETFGNSQIDRVIPAVATFEVNLGFVSRTDSNNRTEKLLTGRPEPRKADLRGSALRNRESR